MKCNYCEEQLENIQFSHCSSIVDLSKSDAYLYVCTSRDCKNCGVVLAIPRTPQED